MAITFIPLKQVPSQSLNTILLGQPCTIRLRLLGGRQYFSLSLNGTIICSMVLIADRSALVRAAYTGFQGELAVIDTQGTEPPQYTGWSTRWVLAFNDAV